MREWIADQLDQGRVFEPGKVRSNEKGVAAVVEPMHEEMLRGRVRMTEKGCANVRKSALLLLNDPGTL